MSKPRKTIGIIAGSGELPRQIADACKEAGRDVFVLGFEDITDPETVRGLPHALAPLGKIGRCIRILRQNNIQEILLAGRVGRPDFSSLGMDVTGIRLLLRLAKLPSRGDDQVFSAIVAFLEEKGFTVLGAEQVLAKLLIAEGPLGKIVPDKTASSDIGIGKKAALAVGALDIGQAVIVQQGQILGVEGAEGTDRLVARCRELHMSGPGGVLVKMKKPGQDSRVDLPSIGVHTVENAYASKLRGIAVEAGGALVIRRDKVIKRADELGLFVVGVRA